MAKQKQRAHREGKEKSMNEHQESRESCGVKAESPQLCSRGGAANRETSKLELSTKQQGS